MAELFPDILSSIVSFIYPYDYGCHIQEILSEYDRVASDKLLYNSAYLTAICKLNEIKEKYGVKKRDLYIAVNTLRTIVNSHPTLYMKLKTFLTYDYNKINNILLEAYRIQHSRKMDKIHQHILQRKHTDICYTNSGCLSCNTDLPYWWPLLQSTNSISGIYDIDSRIKPDMVQYWLVKTNGCIRKGFCSSMCFIQGCLVNKTIVKRNRSFYIRNFEIYKSSVMICQDISCGKIIEPVNAIVNGVDYCNEECYYSSYCNEGHIRKRRRIGY
jgi:hypothetical protein